MGFYEALPIILTAASHLFMEFHAFADYLSVGSTALDFELNIPWTPLE